MKKLTKMFITLISLFLLTGSVFSQQDLMLAHLNEISKNKKQEKSGRAKIESMLKKLKFDYIVVDENFVKVPIEIDGNVSMVFLGEFSIFEDDPSSKYIYISVMVEKIPDDYQMNVPILKQLSIINDRFPIGKVYINFDNNLILYTSSIWSDIITDEIFLAELYMSHYSRIALKEIFSKYINE
ncbi:MAG: hypothetical protein N2319_11705 [Candidatus Kapabacteria bacterium]|nr:hypothetical protein [Candidatus Kapabacteria bacterium]